MADHLRVRRRRLYESIQMVMIKQTSTLMAAFAIASTLTACAGQNDPDFKSDYPQFPAQTIRQDICQLVEATVQETPVTSTWKKVESSRRDPVTESLPTVGCEITWETASNARLTTSIDITTYEGRNENDAQSGALEGIKTQCDARADDRVATEHDSDQYCRYAAGGGQPWVETLSVLSDVPGIAHVTVTSAYPDTQAAIDEVVTRLDEAVTHVQ